MSLVEHGLNRPQCICNSLKTDEVFVYSSPPKGEHSFGLDGLKTYHRLLYKCRFCGHILSVHKMETDLLYMGDYVNSTYKNEEGILNAFERIISLPPEKSDNQGRVARVCDLAFKLLPDRRGGETRPFVLDVGSGLSVFLYLMKKRGWNCIALDPDPRQAAHAEKNVGVASICCDFMEADSIGRYDLITFNKVLEHVVDPVAMLEKSKDFLAKGGLVYIELPDGQMAMADGPHREEFFIDHFHAFTPASLSILVDRAGFDLKILERIHEPSGKYTLWACLSG